MNTQKIFDELDKMLSADDKIRIIAMSKSDFSVEQHFGLGSWIRNNYIYPESDEDLWNYRITHPDDISNQILEDYYDYLLKKEKA